jgi:DMSO/TMAO reductase YedYZ molybdopterin-dependent catalytic subunit
MADTDSLLEQHAQLSRRYFVGLGAAAIAGASLRPSGADMPPALAEAVRRLEYLTPGDRFRRFSRGDPPPDTLSAAEREAVGLTRESWRLEVVPDPETDAQVANPLSRERGTALAWDDLMRLAEEHAVCYLHVMTCLNVADPLGMGLWEGIPLRVVVWLAQPVANIRRVFYHGYHNDDPEQLFRSSLPLGRVLEDPPGEPPVLLCYKLNGQWLSPQRGGPVRMLVPDAYGFKSVKWLQRVVLSNQFQANDTYANWNNDIDTALKTFARFLSCPESVPAGQPIPVTGLVQVGVSGLSRVQVWVKPKGEPLPPDDPYLSRGDWRDADLLGPPERWGGEVGDAPLPATPMGFNAGTGKPEQWPIRFGIAHWATLLPGMDPGEYELRCRTIDAGGHAQPMPRPFPKSGRNAIHQVGMRVEG